MADPVADGGTSRARRRILLVEDNVAACKSLARLLEVYGFDVETACDGETAKTWLSTSSEPDFLLTDLGLPDLDGREVARHARDLFPTLKVIAITGWDDENDEADRAKWGIDWVLTKPVHIETLIGFLSPGVPTPDR